MPGIFGKKLSKAKKSKDFEFNPTDHAGNSINAYIIREMTSDEIRKRAEYTHEDGTTRHEIKE